MRILTVLGGIVAFAVALAVILFLLLLFYALLVTKHRGAGAADVTIEGK